MTQPLCSTVFKKIRCLGTLGAAVAMAILAPGIQAETPAAASLDLDVAGTVSLVLGKAWVQAPSGSRQLISVGTPIHANDKVLTEGNGHVHIRFIDDALVSVRPDSRLEIVRYDYDPASPESSSIKLNLLEGVTRSISGNGAHSARERFRLNTPIAAIGVRGTDSVVNASDTSVRALVNEGVIVMAPYSSDCLAETFGPCAVNAVELTQSSLQMIELDSTTPLPRLTPSPYEPSLVAPQTQTAAVGNVAASEDKTAPAEVYLESVTSIRVTSQANTLSSQINTPPVTPPVTPPPAPVPVVPDFTPVVALSPAVLTQSQLVWGRWAAGAGGQERITTAYADASAGRDVTVGNSDFVLFRTENGSKQIASGLGVVSFGLDTAQAFYHSDSGALAMQVNGGQLSIDFDTERFSTWLGLNHSATGAVDFSASGRLYSGGYFYENLDTQRMAGAVSRDGAGAGYFFEKQIDGGTVKGLTLWERQ